MAALVAVLCHSSATAAEPEVEYFLAKDGAGLSVIGGFGYQFAGVGAAVSYHQPLGRTRFMLVPHLGAGVLIVDLSLEHYANVPSRAARIPLGASGGLSLTYGDESRAVVDLSYGLAQLEELSLHGTPIDQHRVQAIEAGVGFERVWLEGFVIRVIPALMLPVGSRLGGPWARVGFTGMFGAGYKFW